MRAPRRDNIGFGWLPGNCAGRETLGFWFDVRRRKLLEVESAGRLEHGKKRHRRQSATMQIAGAVAFLEAVPKLPPGICSSVCRLEDTTFITHRNPKKASIYEMCSVHVLVELRPETAMSQHSQLGSARV